MWKVIGLFYSILMVVSSLWPLEPNPLEGDPFIIVNKQTNELAFISNGELQYVKPVATGKDGHLTPEGIFTIVVKAKDPYYRKENIQGGAPNNPLGTRWIGFDARDTDGRIYGVHGTHDDTSIGKYISLGCIRMHNQDVEQLYNEVPIGTKILIVTTNESFHELGKQNGALIY